MGEKLWHMQRIGIHMQMGANIVVRKPIKDDEFFVYLLRGLI